MNAFLKAVEARLEAEREARLRGAGAELPMSERERRAKTAAERRRAGLAAVGRSQESLEREAARKRRKP